MTDTMIDYTETTADTFSGPNRITFTPAEFRSIASVGIAADTGLKTPIITGVNISVTAGMLTAIATDKYRVARVEFRVRDTTTFRDFEITISAKALTAFWNTVKANAFKGNNAVEFTVIAPKNDNIVSPNVPIRFELSCVGATITGEGIYGAYPPVSRLMEGYELERVATVRLACC